MKLRILILSLLFAASCYCQNKEIAKKTSQPIIYPVDLSYEGYNSFSVLDSNLSDYNFFMSGENHGVSVNLSIQHNLLRYLYENASVRYLVWEAPKSFGYFINQYLETGDSLYLRNVLTLFPYWFEEYERFFTTLYEFNTQQPKAERIKVIAVDIEFSSTYKAAMAALVHIISEDSVFFSRYKSINTLYQFLNDTASKSEQEVNSMIQDVKTDMDKNKDDWQKKLEGKWFDFKKVADGFLNSFEFEGRKKFIEREKALYKNFMAQTDTISKGKFYGQFGTHHKELKSSGSWKSFASQLNNNDYFENKVLSIGTVYIDCLSIMEKEKYTEWDVIKKKDTLLIHNSLVDAPLLVDYRGIKKYKHITKYSQVFIVVKDQDQYHCVKRFAPYGCKYGKK